MSAPDLLITYPPELPVSAARDEIARAIRDHQVVIVAGATGSGKTTQLPKICLELGRERIAHTQPRRIAARTIAERIADELHVPIGGLVGYRVRFTDRISDETRIGLVTDGVLLNEIHRDRLLRRYDTIIVDEAHERSLNIDFLLGYLTRILPQRPDLKVVITSATIDPESFAAHFSRALGSEVPVIEVSGRTYPVDIRYRPLLPRTTPAIPAAEGGSGVPEAPEPTDRRSSAPRRRAPAGGDADAADADPTDGILGALRELDRETPGDVLVFLPGEAEIRDAVDAVRGAYAKDAAPTEVLPLYGRLSAAEQHRVFEPSAVAGVRRRVILATNVAETSLTVPGIRYVIDTGTARISRYSARSTIQRLPIEPVSQASAQQRAGRAGRTAPGIAIRLYDEDDFDRRPEFTEPEILRTGLAAVVLQMLALGFGDIASFPFLTPPDSRGVKAALDLLVELGAVRAGRTPELTAIGRRIARLPIDPRFARMLVEAERTAVLPDVLAIVAGLSIQDVRERPEEQREQATQAHARFADPTSDFLSLLNLWQHLREQQRELGSSAFRRMCRAEFLNYVRVREWFDVHGQLAQAMGVPRGTTAHPEAPEAPAEAAGTRADTIHRAVLSGLLSQIGILDEREKKPAKTDRRAVPEYRGARGVRFAVFPGSGLRKRRADAVMAAELVETSRLYARTVAEIDPAWAEPLAGDLAKRQLSDPHWSKDAGAAVAAEKVTLFGVEIVPRRRVQLARFDRPLARELFLRHALVEEDWDASALDKRLTAFVRRNLELRRRLEKIEERERRRDILVGDEAVFAFYDARVPADVVDVRAFEGWWREASARTPHLLDLSEADLLGAADRSAEGDFPPNWRQGDQRLSLAYRFEPGSPDDGVTVVVPLALLASLRPDGFDWQVPGLRDELVTALLRALPKAIRRHVVPAADWAARFAEELGGSGPEAHDGMPPQSLRAALAGRIQRVANQPVTAADFELDRVPPHLTMSFRAVDERGRAVGSDRDLGLLQERLAGRARSSVARSLERAGSRPDGPARVAGTGAAGPGAGGPGPASTAAFAERTGLTTWDFDDLLERVDTPVAGGVVRGYPALVDEGGSAALRIEATPDAAARATRRGVRALLLLAVPSPASYVLEHLTSAEKLALAASPYPSAKALIEDARVAVADAALARAAPDGILRTRAAFEAARADFSARSVDDVFATVSLVARILTLAREVERGIRDQTSLALMGPLGDIRAQLSGLVHPGFLARAGLARLPHVERYLRALLARLAGLADNPGRDRQRQTEFERAAAAYAEAGGTIPLPDDPDPRLAHARWLLEELRVSLFAQSLGTAEPVSPQRILKALRP
ncbi:ATP-dependent RNA helicase HrpA [Microbacterium sp. X-17]|uniref:ATP-dependent RNA helicase HrpA n=1 Tax=Microbacterium sp. X-17 TaxID=3144404 RepID=UPI0031F5C35E